MARATACRWAVTSLLLLAVTACAGVSNSAPSARLPLSPCTVQSIAARCGQLTVAENPSAPNGRKISLRIVVVPARSSEHAADPLFYLAGGPGGAASDSIAWAYAHFYLLNQRHDLVFIDQRGTGGSNRVSCSFAQWSSAEGGLAEAINACLTSIRDKADPRFYTTPMAVDDFDRVRAALGYDRIDLYGGSYGVSSGLAYIQRHGDHVRAALFDSGSLLEAHLWERVPLSAQHALDEVFARCAAEEACAAAFPHLKGEFAELTAQLLKSPVQSQTVDPTSHAFLKLDLAIFLSLVIDGYLGDIRSAASLPKDIHAAARGDWSAFLKRLATASADAGSKQMMYITIVCSDQWAMLSPETIAAIGSRSAFTPQTMSQAQLYNSACRYWPRSTGATGPVKSAVPIVFLNGTADPADPPANVADANVTMPNSLVVPIEGFGHGVIDQDSSHCLADKATTFIEAGVAMPLATWAACPNLLPSFVTP